MKKILAVALLILFISPVYALNCDQTYLGYPFEGAGLNRDDDGVKCFYHDTINKKTIINYLSGPDDLSWYYEHSTGPWTFEFPHFISCKSTNSIDCQFVKHYLHQ